MQPESTPNTSQESPAGSVPNAPPQLPQDTLDIIQIQQYFSSASGVFEPQRLLEGYRDLSKVNALLEANRLLELLAAGTTKKKKGGKLDSALTAEQERDILRFAKCCIVTIDLWVEEAHVFEERPLANADLIYRTARYESADSEQDALYAEFYSALKKEHHFFFAKNYGPARDLFQKSASDGRSTFLSRVKNETFQPIFGTLIPSAGTMGFDVSTDPQCLNLLGYKSSSKTYSPLPPILWDNGEKGDVRFIFRSTILMKILFVIFYGPTSLKLKDSNKPVKSKTTNAILWKLEEVTPGTIAYAATVARFVLAGDECFDKRGAQSGINYASDYYQYKKTIIEAINTPYMKETITAYNQFLFDGRPSRHGSNRRGASDDDVEFVQLHEAFAAASDSESDTPAVNDPTPDTPVVDPEIQNLIRGVETVDIQTAASSHDEVQNVHMPEARHSQRVRVATIPGDNDLAVTTEANVAQAKGRGCGVIPRGKAGGRGRGRGHGTQKQSDVPQPDARPTHRNTRVDTQQQVVQDELEGLEDDDVYG
ncbi:hypothetical protein ARMSODRAFT_976633 [Armillaria solidipes]|uniref:Uncharacterized protein n=1 Tax=Armillaria solidipes TaxID=1076256 RepID=A0A2H3BTH6_9AGAR|nr:hypothetical protein ARMSODRAFT_976633 [Armillaria solidipes]